jgi:AcrR family transcriptional regulator
VNKKQMRIRQVFIDSAKEIIDSQGLEAVSAREISKVSGYSYTTVYNYFKDMDSLLTHVAVDYLEESYQLMIQGLEEVSSIKEKIIVASQRYFEYMYNHPSIFKIIFINQFGQEVEEVADKLIPKVTILLHQLLKQLSDHQINLDREILFQLISGSIHAKLMFVIYKRSPMNLSQNLMLIEREINGLVGEKQ